MNASTGVFEVGGHQTLGGFEPAGGVAAELSVPPDDLYPGQAGEVEPPVA